MFGIRYDLMKRLSTLRNVQPVVKQCGFTKYAMEIQKRFDMLECKAMTTPMDTNLKLLADESSELVDVIQYKQIIRSLMYLITTKPDICFVVNTLSQYLVKPRCVHLIVAKNVIRYLKGMIEFGLYYFGNHD